MKRLLTTIAACTVLAACVTEPEAPARTSELGRHRGAVLEASPSAVWEATKAALAELGATSVNEATLTARASLADGNVVVQVQPMDASGTRAILRVAAESQGRDAPEVADRVQLSIQRALAAG